MRWFYHDGSQQVGPVDAATIVALIGSGRVQPGTPVWKEGTPSWTTAAQSELASRFAIPRQPTPTRAPESTRKGITSGKLVLIILGSIVGGLLLLLFVSAMVMSDDPTIGGRLHDFWYGRPSALQVPATPAGLPDEYAQAIVQEFQRTVPPYMNGRSQIAADVLYVFGCVCGRMLLPLSADSESAQKAHDAAWGLVSQQLSGLGSLDELRGQAFARGYGQGLMEARESGHPAEDVMRRLEHNQVTIDLPIAIRNGIAAAYFAAMDTRPRSDSQEDLIAHFVESCRSIGMEAGRHVPDGDGRLMRIAYDHLFAVFTPERMELRMDPRITAAFLSGYSVSQQVVFEVRMGIQASSIQQPSPYQGNPAYQYNRPITPYSQP